MTATISLHPKLAEVLDLRDWAERMSLQAYRVAPRQVRPGQPEIVEAVPLERIRDRERRASNANVTRIQRHHRSRPPAPGPGPGAA